VQVISFSSQVGTQTFLQIVLGGHCTVSTRHSPGQ